MVKILLDATFSAKGMTPNFLVFVIVLLPICHIGWTCHICAFLLKKLSRY